MGCRKSFNSMLLFTITSYFLISDSTVSCSDTLVQGKPFNSTDSLISAGGDFTLGFFKPKNSNSTYLGIKYTSFFSETNGIPSQEGSIFDDYGLRTETSDSVIVWIANPDTPILDDYGVVLVLNSMGKLIIKYSGGDPIEIFAGETGVANTSATLQEDGNFVVTEVSSDGSSGRVLWQSFDHPTDTLLPGMKLGVNHKTGRTWSLTSWSADGDPASGAFSLDWDSKAQQLVVKRRGVVYWTSGASSWNKWGTSFEFINGENLNYDFIINVTNEEEYFIYFLKQDQYLKAKSKWLLDYNGFIRDGYDIVLNMEECYGYNTDFGCSRWEQPECRASNHKFYLRSGSFYGANGTDIGISYGNASLGPSDCRAKCWNDCDCVGYGAYNGTCQIWRGSYSFTEDFSGATAYRYVALKEPSDGIEHSGKSRKKEIWIASAVAISLFVILLGILCYAMMKFKRKGHTKRKKNYVLDLTTADRLAIELEKDGQNLKVFSFACIVEATSNFSQETKLGEGGFGPVYKGKLLEGQEIAVKRLSRGSGQGSVELKNELILIAKLQHMNLVRILGCCIHKEEKMLIYEYMPNKSLDSFLFDPSKRELLDWTTRVNIIEGISQGLLYLHKYSRLKIIHRDLKASNILLDENMNPKISDFGMARICKQNELKANTNRIVGTYGYMSPEYAMEGIFSVKSDIFSFGVLLLEIVSGRKNNSFCDLSGPLNLVGYAWDLWQKGAGLEIMDQMLKNSCSEHQLLRFIHVGLACVEDCPTDRPTISDVVSMLTNESWSLPVLKKPAFLIRRRLNFAELQNTNLENYSVNRLSLSTMNAR